MNANDVVLAITGASGSAYALRLAQALLAAGKQLHLVVSGAARQVLACEMDAKFPDNAASAVEWAAMIDQTLAGPTATAWGFRPLSVSNVSTAPGSLQAYEWRTIQPESRAVHFARVAW